MIAGIFHGDLHGGNLLVLPDGRTGLLDYGIVGRLSGRRRVAFMRLMVVGDDERPASARWPPCATSARSRRTPTCEAVIRDLGLDQAPVDPTTLTGDQMVKEVQRVVKGLLGYGARMPKELMLYVKNMVFLDGAIARLAPDLDILAEIAAISVLFAQRHGAQARPRPRHRAGRARHRRRQGQLRPRPERRAPHPPRAPRPPRPDPATHARA